MALERRQITINKPANDVIKLFTEDNDFEISLGDFHDALEKLNQKILDEGGKTPHIHIHVAYLGSRAAASTFNYFKKKGSTPVIVSLYQAGNGDNIFGTRAINHTYIAEGTWMPLGPFIRLLKDIEKSGAKNHENITYKTYVNRRMDIQYATKESDEDYAKRVAAQEEQERKDAKIRVKNLKKSITSYEKEVADYEKNALKRLETYIKDTHREIERQKIDYQKCINNCHKDIEKLAVKYGEDVVMEENPNPPAPPPAKKAAKKAAKQEAPVQPVWTVDDDDDDIDDDDIYEDSFLSEATIA